MELIKKYKPYIIDLFLNTAGFAIYIASQHILLLPILAKVTNDTIYSSVVLYISILNLIGTTLGGGLGNVRLIRNSDYEEKNILGDFFRILIIAFLIISVIGLPICIYKGYSLFVSCFLIITILMANIRIYSTSYFRLDNKYNRVILQSVIYCIGIIVSLIVFYFLRKMYLLLFIPELLCFIYEMKTTDLLKMKLAKTIEMMNTVKTFIKISVVSFLANLMSYFDRFVIYPMFGATSLAVYFAVNSMANMFNLVATPISSIILPWVSNVKGEETKNKIIKLTLFINIPVIIFVTLFAIPLTYIALRILYSQYLTTDNIMILIIATSIATSLGVAASFVKSVLLKFCSANKLVISYFVYFLVFILSAYLLSHKFNLIGFSIANIISKCVLLVCFIIMLVKILKIKNNE